MSRPRKPTAHLELVGAFKKNPQRVRDGEPESAAGVIKPPFMSDREDEAWDFLVEWAAPGVLTVMDSAYLWLAAKALTQVSNGVIEILKDGESVRRDVKIGELKQAGELLGKLGMTPSDRSRILVPKKKTESKFAQFQPG